MQILFQFFRSLKNFFLVSAFMPNCNDQDERELNDIKYKVGKFFETGFSYIIRIFRIRFRFYSYLFYFSTTSFASSFPTPFS